MLITIACIMSGRWILQKMTNMTNDSVIFLAGRWKKKCEIFHYIYKYIYLYI